MNLRIDLECYRGKKVLVTGHTGFKGSWLCEWLLALGADVYGFSNGIPTKPSLFVQLRLAKRIKRDICGDVRDRSAVYAAIKSIRPDFVFHLAAQPLVRLSYAQPVETFDTNIMGTVNVLDALRRMQDGKSKIWHCSAVCITTDKVYENNEKGLAFKESDALGGYDPYSASKGACEVAIQSYRRAFFSAPDCRVRIASARAGNVIGGGDWAIDRIVPDAMRAYLAGSPLAIRNNRSTRPWQHVLEPLSGYLMLGAWLDVQKGSAKLRESAQSSYAFNFGPDPKNVKTVGQLVKELSKTLRTLKTMDRTDPNAVHEARLLTLDSHKATSVLGWKPDWDFKTTVAMVARWYDAVMVAGENAAEVTQRQIAEFCA